MICSGGISGLERKEGTFFIPPNKREIGPKESGVNQGFWQLHATMWQSQADSPNTICLQLCYFTYLTNRRVLIFLPLQKGDSHCLEKKKLKTFLPGTLTEPFTENHHPSNFLSRVLHPVSKHSQEGQADILHMIDPKSCACLWVCVHVSASVCVCVCVPAHDHVCVYLLL